MKKYKVLVLHGWLHSAKRYKELYNVLSDFCEVELYEFSGFGNTRYTSSDYDVLAVLSHELDMFLRNRVFDLIITHSMGGNILLKTLQKNKNLHIKNVLLSNTSYYGMPVLMPIAWMVPFNVLLLSLCKVLPVFLTKPVVKIVSLLTIDKVGHFDDIMFEDAIGADAFIAAIALFQLTYDRFRIRAYDKERPRFYITYSVKDRIIPKRNTRRLAEDLSVKKVYRFGGGHTVVLEAKEKYVNFIKKILRGEQ